MISDTLKEKVESLPAILSVQEAADFFSAHCRTIHRLILAGKIPAWEDDEGSLCIARLDLKKICSQNSNL